MSYDLAVWRSEIPYTDQEAGETYVALCEDNDSAFERCRAIQLFYEELTLIYPEIDSLSDEDTDDTDLCPWSNEIDRYAGALILCCVYSKSETVHQKVLELAEKHQLSVFDPQIGKVTHFK
ncbi:MAG: hypothetical protein ACE37H_17120 [Phycisphaeraceae bacterium]